MIIKTKFFDKSVRFLISVLMQDCRFKVFHQILKYLDSRALRAVTFRV